MKCPYPDCQGDVTATDVFCGECGRSLAPNVVNAFLQQNAQAPSGQPLNTPAPNIQPPSGQLPNTPPLDGQAQDARVSNVQPQFNQAPNTQPQFNQPPNTQPQFQQPPNNQQYNPNPNWQGQPAPKPQPNRVPLIIGVVGALVLLVIVGCIGIALASNGSKPTPTAVIAKATATTKSLADVTTQPTATSDLAAIFGIPTSTPAAAAATSTTSTTAGAATPTLITATGDAQTFNFALTDLTAANNFEVSYGANDSAGNKLGDVGLTSSWQYGQQGSPEKLISVIVELDKKTVLELSTAENPLIAADNPAYEVAEEGKTYQVVSSKGWIFAVTVHNLKIDTAPLLGNGKTGVRPVFTSLALDVVMTTGPDGSALAPTPAPSSLNASYDFDLSQLTAANDHTVNFPMRSSSGQKLGVVTVSYDYSYADEGAPDILTTLEVQVNNELMFELTASDQAQYATATPNYLVVQADQTYSNQTKAGWQVTTKITDLSVDDNPLLPDGRTGNQPAFSRISFTVNVNTKP